MRFSLFVEVVFFIIVTDTLRRAVHCVVSFSTVKLKCIVEVIFLVVFRDQSLEVRCKLCAGYGVALDALKLGTVCACVEHITGAFELFGTVLVEDSTRVTI